MPPPAPNELVFWGQTYLSAGAIQWAQLDRKWWKLSIPRRGEELISRIFIRDYHFQSSPTSGGGGVLTKVIKSVRDDKQDDTSKRL